MDLYSTVVPPQFEGKGIGKILAKEAFQHCRENNLKMKLTCWYLDGYLKRNPDPEISKLLL